MSRWLRINEDCIDHPKLLKLPEALRWQWVALLCVASKNCGVLPPIDDVALCLRVTEAKAAEYITKLVKAKLIDKEGDTFVPHNWAARQYKTKDVPPEDKGKYIYFIGSAMTPSIVKIGISKNPWSRVSEFQTSHPEKLSVSATFKTKETSEVEIHTILAKFRRQGEWFDLPPSALDVVHAAHAAKSDYASLVILLRSWLRSFATENEANYVVIPRAEAKAESDTQQSTADARAPEDIWMEGERTLINLFFAVSKGLGRKPPDMKIIAVWLSEGISTATISAVVTPILKRKADMKSLVYCDAAVREAHANEAKPASAPSLQVVAKKVFVVQGTDAWICWHQVSPGGRGWPTRDRRDADGRTQTGWDFETEWPPGYNDFGERLPPKDEDAA